MRTKGKLTSWNEDKGFGFITPMAGGKQIFVHIKAFSNRNRRPVVGQIVTYSMSSDKQGRTCAINATRTGDRPSDKVKRNSGLLSIVAAVIFFSFVGISVLSSRIPFHVLALYIVASLFTFIMYALDKSAARSGEWRTQESTLHVLSLVGGWPGALIAQQKLRHKSKKQSFRSIFWVTVLLNCGVFAWLFTSTGAATLDFLIGLIM